MFTVVAACVKTFPDSCLYTKPSYPPDTIVSTPDINAESLLETFKPFKSPYSKPNWPVLGLA